MDQNRLDPTGPGPKLYEKFRTGPGPNVLRNPRPLRTRAKKKRNPGPTLTSTKFILENPDRLGPGPWIPNLTEISGRIFDANGMFFGRK